MLTVELTKEEKQTLYNQLSARKDKFSDELATGVSPKRAKEILHIIDTCDKVMAVCLL